jgi:hypothetical protein
LGRQHSRLAETHRLAEDLRGIFQQSKCFNEEKRKMRHADRGLRNGEPHRNAHFAFSAFRMHGSAANQVLMLIWPARGRRPMMLVRLPNGRRTRSLSGQIPLPQNFSLPRYRVYRDDGSTRDRRARSDPPYLLAVRNRPPSYHEAHNLVRSGFRSETFAGFHASTQTTIRLLTVRAEPRPTLDYLIQIILSSLPP